ncbi:cell division protein ZapA [Tistrella bauzanensis]|uniref:Cell division protein ZapA n=2 Tax=Tistrella TaxID=171436 RepID=A0ABU9YIV2_9PROT|nr:cell division protein ZapA [Tistrella bauzanensis]GGB28890.1 hypothetical protein GCM10011505_07730 [Tistrella bauzanensis]
MAEVEVRILGRAFTLACGEGQEDSVRALAHKLEDKVRQVTGDRPVAVDARVMLMAALLLADQANESEQGLYRARIEVDKMRRSADRSAAEVDATLARALDDFAGRIEAIATRLEKL